VLTFEEVSTGKQQEKRRCRRKRRGRMRSLTRTSTLILKSFEFKTAATERRAKGKRDRTDHGAAPRIP
jgi:hypothetical protein